MISADRAAPLRAESAGLRSGDGSRLGQNAHGAGRLAGPASPQQICTNTAVVLRWMKLDKTDADAEGCRRFLDEMEQDRADRFRFAEDRHAYMASHALLRLMLSEAGGVPPKAWRFLTRPGGKPYIHPDFRQPDLHFSLSHTRGMVACAVGRISEIGVDAEFCHRELPVIEMARFVFAPAEIAQIERLPVDGRVSMFYRLWTLKEAYGKATGRGMTAPMHGFAFLPDPDGITLSPHGFADPDSWLFREFKPGDTHWIALAVQHRAAGAVHLDAASVSMRAFISQASELAGQVTHQKNAETSRAIVLR